MDVDGFQPPRLRPSLSFSPPPRPPGEPEFGRTALLLRWASAAEADHRGPAADRVGEPEEDRCGGSPESCLAPGCRESVSADARGAAGVLAGVLACVVVVVYVRPPGRAGQDAVRPPAAGGDQAEQKAADGMEVDGGPAHASGLPEAGAPVAAAAAAPRRAERNPPYGGLAATADFAGAGGRPPTPFVSCFFAGTDDLDMPAWSADGGGCGARLQPVPAGADEFASRAAFTAVPGLRRQQRAAAAAPEAEAGRVFRELRCLRRWRRLRLGGCPRGPEIQPAAFGALEEAEIPPVPAGLIERGCQAEAAVGDEAPGGSAEQPARSQTAVAWRPFPVQLRRQAGTPYATKAPDTLCSLKSLRLRPFESEPGGSGNDGGSRQRRNCARQASSSPESALDKLMWRRPTPPRSSFTGSEDALPCAESGSGGTVGGDVVGKTGAGGGGERRGSPDRGARPDVPDGPDADEQMADGWRGDFADAAEDDRRDSQLVRRGRADRSSASDGDERGPARGKHARDFPAPDDLGVGFHLRRRQKLGGPGRSPSAAAGRDPGGGGGGGGAQAPAAGGPDQRPLPERAPAEGGVGRGPPVRDADAARGRAGRRPAPGAGGPERQRRRHPGRLDLPAAALAGGQVPNRPALLFVALVLFLLLLVLLLLNLLLVGRRRAGPARAAAFPAASAARGGRRGLAGAAGRPVARADLRARPPRRRVAAEAGAPDPRRRGRPARAREDETGFAARLKTRGER
ncbi:MAG: hypothetical protein BJ554DRAFT_4793 [Olpidium bornovanus]|uniref:Uncharacterized protein n=1 Tax=Olpidium bornovanus TaxID=278681 RepID=A0A8H7ZLL9_9FUNG|nr:MAG: hypothetical protein BJ554DRAFT_4793 [Olpidium bornovanus]